MMEREELFLNVVNALSLPILKGIKRCGDVWVRADRSPTNVFFDWDFRSRRMILNIELPRESITYVLYISTQQWYMTPSKTLPKIRKVIIWSRGYVGSRIYRAIITKRYTSGAAKLAAEFGTPLRTPKQVRNDIINYFKERLTKLIDAMKGKRIYGYLAWLAWLFQQILMYYGVKVKVFEDDIHAMRAIDSGYLLPAF